MFSRGCHQNNIANMADREGGRGGRRRGGGWMCSDSRRAPVSFSFEIDFVSGKIAADTHLMIVEWFWLPQQYSYMDLCKDTVL